MSRAARARSQGRNLEAKIKAMEEHGLLACSLPLAQPTSSILQDHMPKDGNTHNDLATPTSIIKQENAPQTCLQANLIEAIPSLRLPSFLVTLAFQVDKLCTLELLEL